MGINRNSSGLILFRPTTVKVDTILNMIGRAIRSFKAQIIIQLWFDFKEKQWWKMEERKKESKKGMGERCPKVRRRWNGRIDVNPACRTNVRWSLLWRDGYLIEDKETTAEDAAATVSPRVFVFFLRLHTANLKKKIWLKKDLHTGLKWFKEDILERAKIVYLPSIFHWSAADAIKINQAEFFEKALSQSYCKRKHLFMMIGNEAILKV